MVKKSKKCVIKVTDIYETEVHGVKCTKLPEFLRAKKNLGAPFCVYVEDKHFAFEGTRVTITAGNAKNPNAEMRNNISYLKNGIAQFDDLRFVGKSGRGSRFNVYIRFDTWPVAKLVTYSNAIKVTVDGPRPARRIAKVKNDLNVVDKYSKMGLSVPLKKRYRDLVLDESPLMTLCPNSNLTPPQTPTDRLGGDFVYRELVNAYLLIYMDLYKIKITKQLAGYLVDLIINNYACDSFRNNNFAFNFSIFYQSLISNLGQPSLKNNLRTTFEETCDNF